MSIIARRGIHYAAKVSSTLLEKGQSRVIDASLTLIRERAKLKACHICFYPACLNLCLFSAVSFIPQYSLLERNINAKVGELVRALGGAVATSSLLGVPLGHNSSFLQGPAFAPPRIREAIWCGSTNSTTEEGKDLQDARVLTDVGDVPIQELRDCGVDDHRLMNVIGESVKLVMEEDPLRPLVLGGDHSISFPVIRAVSEKLGGPLDVLHLDAHPDNYDAYEGNIYSHASSFARVMEGDYVGIRSISAEGRAQGKKFGVEQYEMRTFSRDRHFLENLT
ncbi:Arginase 1, mitochondrial, partial [Mucuna pruriens]